MFRKNIKCKSIIKTQKMKNLEILGVQEMNTVEMKEQSGGCWWCNVRDNVVKPVAEIIIKTVTKPICGTLPCPK